ncbi:peptidoglycan-binding domain-containing protein [Streptomyces sp. NPDC005492]|uniref:peptidoglycan-binding domain-containing protein n=1 Tax=Streptomyces sp. NPDC005492 TaxID=3156883 RepID=UPI0033A10400
MNEAKGHICPQCGAPRAADGSPSCSCTERASEALRDARTAEAAAAEDFDPLRIRPYVELDGNARESPEGETQPLPAVEETMPLRAVPPTAADTSILPALRTADLSLFEDGGGTPAPPTDADSPRSRRRTVLLAAAGTVVAVVAAAGFASGLFSYETPSRDDAGAQDVRPGLPSATASTAPVTPSTSGSTSARPTSASPAPSLSASPSSSPSSTPSATASRSANPSPTQTATASATASAGTGRRAGSSAAPVLRPGDKGTEVTELQLRLAQVYLYTGTATGTFDDPTESALKNYQWSRGIQSDTLGVYGAATRTKLESETTQP